MEQGQPPSTDVDIAATLHQAIHGLGAAFVHFGQVLPQSKLRALTGLPLAACTRGRERAPGPTVQRY
jgi:hypothetical protein